MERLQHRKEESLPSLPVSITGRGPGTIRSATPLAKPVLTRSIEPKKVSELVVEDLSKKIGLPTKLDLDKAVNMSDYEKAVQEWKKTYSR